MWARVAVVFDEAFARLGAVLASDLPGIVAMLLVVLSSVVAAALVQAALRFALARVGFDRRAREWGMTNGHGIEPQHAPSWLVARGAFWVVCAAGISLALAVLGASATSLVGLTLLGFLPRLVVGLVVLLVGLGVARFLERAVLIGAVNQGVRRARLVAWGVKWVMLVLAGAMALQHVGVGGLLPTLAFAILVGGAVLAAAIAVGLGASGAVGRALERGTEADDGAGETPPEDRIHHL